MDATDYSECSHCTETQSTSEDESRESISSSSVRNVLSQLRSPTSSELARKRKVDRNLPRGKRRSRAHGVNDPKTISPLQ